MRKAASLLISVWCLYALCVPALAEEYIHGYLRYTVADQSVAITAYTGQETVVTIPSMIAGNPVNTIAAGAFSNSPTVVTIQLPDTVVSIEEGALGVGQTVVYLNSNAAASEQMDEPDLENEVGRLYSIGLMDGQGGIVTTDDLGNLVRVDSAGIEYVLDDSGPFRRVIDDGYVTAIVDPSGQAVRFDEDGAIAYTRDNGDAVSIDPDGARSVYNAAERYTYEETYAEITEEETAEVGSIDAVEAEEETFSTLSTNISAETTVPSAEQHNSARIIVLILVCVLAAVCLIVYGYQKKRHSH